ncbi:MAG: sensor histidine kinase [Anaerolineae bacterium]|nr:sensor histidine kinase [Anaerolineae bacterium]
MSHSSVTLPMVESRVVTERAQASKPVPRLSTRVFALSQLLPIIILAVVMFYEVTAHLLIENQTHPLLFAMETIVFGIIGPAVTWATLNWVAREIRERERAEGEADALNAMMQEMHHRIKNNLQTVADLLTLEMSRNPRPEVQESLRDSITRIKSIAASHEMLSVESVGVTDITELAQRVVQTTRRSMVRPDQRITIRVTGPNVYLGSKQATAFAIVLNELVSNAIEHGFRERTNGTIEVELDWDGMDVWLRVQDDGIGLPEGFDLNTSRGLGLQIARTLVEKDLCGKLTLTRHTNGTTAWVLFRRGSGLSYK